MIVGLGLDVCPVERMTALLGRFGGRLEARLFTETERADCGGRANSGERYAGRFAAKEAAIKALGGPPGLRWHDFEIERGPRGEPLLSLRGEAGRVAKARGSSRAWLSLSHAGGVAVAVVVLETEA
jgi:holo-[acyl-carrier protein] synthase